MKSKQWVFIGLYFAISPSMASHLRVYRLFLKRNSYLCPKAHFWWNIWNTGNYYSEEGNDVTYIVVEDGVGHFEDKMN